MDIILASASPRRKELLTLLCADFRVIPSEFDEDLVPDHLSPAEHVVYSAMMKARDVAARLPDALVIGSDTIVVLGDRIMGKPTDREDAARMLQALSGATHQVYSGLAIERGDMERTDFECTDVAFRTLDDETIARYVATGEPMDKAGAYAIQGKGAVLIRSVCGCYSNVVGLPIYKLSVMLEEFGIRPL